MVKVLKQIYSDMGSLTNFSYWFECVSFFLTLVYYDITIIMRKIT